MNKKTQNECQCYCHPRRDGFPISTTNPLTCEHCKPLPQKYWGKTLKDIMDVEGGTLTLGQAGAIIQLLSTTHKDAIAEGERKHHKRYCVKKELHP